MTTSTKQSGITLTSNRLAALCDPPEAFVRDGHRTCMPYTERWHRTPRDEFPTVRPIPHPYMPELVVFDVCVTYDPATDELEGNFTGLRLRNGKRAREFKCDIPLTAEIKRQVETRGLLNV